MRAHAWIRPQPGRKVLRPAPRRSRRTSISCGAWTPHRQPEPDPRRPDSPAAMTHHQHSAPPRPDHPPARPPGRSADPAEPIDPHALLSMLFDGDATPHAQRRRSFVRGGLYPRPLDRPHRAARPLRARTRRPRSRRRHPRTDHLRHRRRLAPLRQPPARHRPPQPRPQPDPAQGNHRPQSARGPLPPPPGSPPRHHPLRPAVPRRLRHFASRAPVIAGRPLASGDQDPASRDKSQRQLRLLRTHLRPRGPARSLRPGHRCPRSRS